MTIRDMTNKRLLDRFWAKVDRSGGCWIWIGCRGSRNYGWFSYNGRMVAAHRFSYELAYGPIPDGLFCCHHCDTPPCVRPDHLFVADHVANMSDMRMKGRSAKGDMNGTRQHADRVVFGERHGRAKLTDGQIDEIRSKKASGVRSRELAAQYQVSTVHINRIVAKHRRAK